jgi:hypothetical protein
MLFLKILIFLSICYSSLQSHRLSCVEQRLLVPAATFLPEKESISARFNTANEIVIDLGKAITGTNEIEKPANIKAVFPRVEQYCQKAKIQPLRAKFAERPMLKVVNSNCKKNR